MSDIRDTRDPGIYILVEFGAHKMYVPIAEFDSVYRHLQSLSFQLHLLSLCEKRVQTWSGEIEKNTFLHGEAEILWTKSYTRDAAYENKIRTSYMVNLDSILGLYKEELYEAEEELLEVTKVVQRLETTFGSYLGRFSKKPRIGKNTIYSVNGRVLEIINDKGAKQ